jgi:glutamate-ammonia-ligase adenylyltransferase
LPRTSITALRARVASVLAAVACALGYPADGDSGVFLDDYRRVTRRARTVVERVFYGW